MGDVKTKPAWIVDERGQCVLVQYECATYRHAGMIPEHTVFLGGEMGDGNRRTLPSVYEDDALCISADKWND